MFRPNQASINISSSFCQRSRCKSCGSGPAYYYPLRKGIQWHDVQQFQKASPWLRFWLNKTHEDWYLESQPKHFTNMSNFTFRLSDKSFNPIRHRTRGNDLPESLNVIDVVVCGCGKTQWKFCEKSARQKPEVFHRKGKYHYPDSR
jgi:hypothetical protein